MRLTNHDASFVFASSNSDTEFSGSGARVAATAVTAGQTPSSQIRVLPLLSRVFAEYVSLPTDDPIEHFSEEDMATGSMAVGGRSPNKHPRTGSEENSLDIAALLDRAADRFSACMDTKVDSMMDRLEKRIDEIINSKHGPVMDRLSVLEKTSSSTRSAPSSLSDNGEFCRSEQCCWRYTCSICSFLLGNQGLVRISRQTHAWPDGGSGLGDDHSAATGNVSRP